MTSIRIDSIADLSAAISYGMEYGSLLLSEANLGPRFFDLRSRLAGELMQKCVNYRIPLAIVVPAPEAYGERFIELVREHRQHHAVRFFASQSEAAEWLGTAR